jgi:pyridoxamine 5'-phosphate oxidase
MDLSDLRREYRNATLDESSVDSDPIVQFMQWFTEARASESVEPNAMTLATVAPDGRPSARIVLLKGVGDDGFVFYTDQRSRKGRELTANAAAALVFWWPELERQVRVTGQCVPLESRSTEGYFLQRPRGSQLGAWASEQSSILASRGELEERLRAVEARFAEAPVPRPPYWSGYRVEPDEIEFWQGRPSRLHDRIVYTRTPEHGWRIARLSP